MYYNTAYVGMDVHKNSFTLCAYTIESEKASYFERTEADYKKVLKYLEFLRTIYGNNTKFLCGYEGMSWLYVIPSIVSPECGLCNPCPDHDAGAAEQKTNQNGQT
jgi:hypothetical protein